MRERIRRGMWFGVVVSVGIGLLLVSPTPAAAQCQAPRVPVTTIIGMKYCSDPAFDGVIADNVRKIRDDIRAQRQLGRLIIYGSTPISPRGGGHEKVNLEIAASVKLKIEKEYGGSVWVLDPGKYQMPDVGGKWAGGGEYMVMWTTVLAGEDGTGKDFDMAHFTGPADMRAFFGCGKEDLTGCTARWLDARAAADEKLRREIAENAERRQAFIRYYALRASSTYSSGAHDEWNAFVKINRKRRLGEQIAMFFDGRPASPAEMEVEISPGYEVR